MADDRLTLRIDPELRSRLNEAASSQDRSVAYVVRRALEEALGDVDASRQMHVTRPPAPPRASSEPRWTCKACGASNPADAAYCAFCDQRRVPVGVEMAQRRVSGHVRPPIPKKGS